MAAVAVVLCFEAALGGILFGSAGRWDLPWFWAYLAVHTVGMSVMIGKIDPELRKERLRPGPGGRDRQMRYFAAPLIAAHLVIAGLDVGRYHWSGEIPGLLRAAALAGLAAAFGLSTWAMIVNRFFSPVVRIQSERGHHVITDGPYHFIRHPGYAGAMISCTCSGIVLGSWWSLLPIALCVPLFLRRLMIEERFLHDELAGYPEYVAAVRFRLVPGVW